MEETDLIYYSVKTLKKKRPTSVLLRAVRRNINRFIDDYNSNVLLIESTFFYKSKNTSGLIVLADEIKAVAKRKKLKIVE